MATLKDLFWPHEYSPPLASFKYHLHLCTESKCWGKAVIDDPYLACAAHMFAACRFVDMLRSAYDSDPLWRMEIQESTRTFVVPPHSIYWRMSRLWRKERR